MKTCGNNSLQYTDFSQMKMCYFNHDFSKQPEKKPYKIVIRPRFEKIEKAQSTLNSMK